MRLLVVAPDYPKPGREFGGVFHERSVNALRELCDEVEVMVPRPYAPPLVSHFVARWRIHQATPTEETRNGVHVYRPACLQIPRLGSAFWADPAAFFFCRPTAKRRHAKTRFDAILSFDLAATGALAWRIGRELGIPAAGWATGSDLRLAETSSFCRSVTRSLQELDIVFYQSRELLHKGAELLMMSSGRGAEHEHLVLARGIPEPPRMPRAQMRQTVRKRLRIEEEDILVLNLGRISRSKGIFELLEAVELAAEKNSRITCVIVGSCPAYDESVSVEAAIKANLNIDRRVKLLPACPPKDIWEYLCAADIFVFPSHNEGMPNSLLEAMAMGLPSIAFAIPPVLEIDAGTDALVKVPSFVSERFAEAILQLAGCAQLRKQLGERGRLQVMDRFMVKNNMTVALEKLIKIVQQRRSSKGSGCMLET